jgi:hypothetical protein
MSPPSPMEMLTIVTTNMTPRDLLSMNVLISIILLGLLFAIGLLAHSNRALKNALKLAQQESALCDEDFDGILKASGEFGGLYKEFKEGVLECVITPLH